MDPQQLETLTTFLSQVDKDNLFQYLDLKIEATDEDVEAAIKKRRSWAQGQQSNPKYRTEAIWYIKNIAFIKGLLLNNRAAYIKRLRAEKNRIALRTLGVYILGAMAGGVLSRRAEDAIRTRATKLGLPEALVTQQVDHLLKEQGAHREDAKSEALSLSDFTVSDVTVSESIAPVEDPPKEPQQPEGPEPTLSPPSESGSALDYYAVLGVASGASTQDLEAAYRSRYRQAARQGAPAQVQARCAELDKAWHALRDPLRRTTYDNERRKQQQRSGAALPDDTAPTSPITADPIEDGVTSDAPRLPEGLAQRAYQPGTHSRTPKLEVDGPTQLTFSIGRVKHRHTLTIRNTGQGRMSGRVHADRSWVTPLPSSLDPNIKEQVVELLIDPAEMPRQRGQCRVTISTRAGGNRALMLQVQRSGRIFPLVLGGLLVVGTGIAIAPFIIGSGGDHRTGAGRLILNVDPPVGEIYINDTLISTQGALDIEAGFPLNAPFTVNVQADGFADWFETTTVQDGKTVTLSAELELTDPMNFKPKREWKEGGLANDVLQQELNEHALEFEECFAEANVGAPGYTAILDVKGYINQLGSIARIDYLERNFDAPELDHCIRREFRALSMPLLNPRFDYATFTHTFHYMVPEN
ncbi:MAG: hypothetical protein P8R54_18450 [Myxococcota bacterium]|nr:hypothetical protein [Myxococcota bacterium]